jgi:methylated-DNA-protein-cysteine methyltransferase-like protein
VLSVLPVNYKIIHDITRRIPRGRVATYGQLARVAGWGRRARFVGYAMHSAPDDVPWHRVINAKGEISRRSSSDSHELQRLLLEAEGVEFDAKGRVDLKRFGVRWRSHRFGTYQSGGLRRRTPKSP